MSRTYRRKNYELTNSNSWSRAFKKQLGAGAVYDFVKPENEHFKNWVRVWREPTPEEKWKSRRYSHFDNKSNVFSGGHEWRNNRERKHRQKVRQELHRFMSNHDYEVMVEDSPKSCQWDWT